MTTVWSALLASAALLLVVAGATKVVDPSRTSGALTVLGWPSSPVLIRAGAAGELILGTSTLVFGGPVLAVLVALSYLGFAVFVTATLRHGAPLGSCGCFGQEDTPSSPLHVAVNTTLAAGALGAAATGGTPLVETAGPTWLVATAIALASLATYLRPILHSRS